MRYYTVKPEHILNGWHSISGYDVYVEDGAITRGTLGTGDDQKTACVYRKSRDGWEREYKISVDAFRSGVRRGTIRLM